MRTLANLTNGVIQNRTLGEIRAENVVAKHMLNDPVAVVQGLNFTLFRFMHGEMVITADFKSAAVKSVISVVQVLEHSRLEPDERFFVAFGTPAAHMRLIDAFKRKHFVES